MKILLRTCAYYKLRIGNFDHLQHVSMQIVVDSASTVKVDQLHFSPSFFLLSAMGLGWEDSSHYI
jgi:hypothetical protein